MVIRHIYKILGGSATSAFLASYRHFPGMKALGGYEKSLYVNNLNVFATSHDNLTNLKLERGGERDGALHGRDLGNRPCPLFCFFEMGSFSVHTSKAKPKGGLSNLCIYILQSTNGAKSKNCFLLRRSS